jgi:hypothetical protein
MRSLLKLAGSIAFLVAVTASLTAAARADDAPAAPPAAAHDPGLDAAATASGLKFEATSQGHRFTVELENGRRHMVLVTRPVVFTPSGVPLRGVGAVGAASPDEAAIQDALLRNGKFTFGGWTVCNAGGAAQVLLTFVDRLPEELDGPALARTVRRVAVEADQWERDHGGADAF